MEVKSGLEFITPDLDFSVSHITSVSIGLWLPPTGTCATVYCVQVVAAAGHYTVPKGCHLEVAYRSAVVHCERTLCCTLWMHIVVACHGAWSQYLVVAGVEGLFQHHNPVPDEHDLRALLDVAV